MGILADALVIGGGGLLGSRLQHHKTEHGTIGIAVMIVSLVSFLENMYNVKGSMLSTDHLIVVLLAFLIGSKIGEVLRLEERMSTFGKTDNRTRNAFLDAALFFGIGGLQISGPLTLVLNHSNDQLFIKSMIDAPFALIFGSTYGKVTAIAALPVAALQILIAATAYMCSSLFDPALTAQICAMGYIILFFSGVNLMTDGKAKISNINMLPGILLILLFHIIKRTVGGLL